MGHLMSEEPVHLPDRKRVIKGQKCCMHGICFACPYNDGVFESVGCKHELAKDVLILLERQDE